MRLGQFEPLDEETLVVSDGEFNCNEDDLDLHENGLEPHENDLKRDESALIITDLRLQLQQAKAEAARSISDHNALRVQLQQAKADTARCVLDNDDLRLQLEHAKADAIRFNPDVNELRGRLELAIADVHHYEQKAKVFEVASQFYQHRHRLLHERVQIVIGDYYRGLEKALHHPDTEKGRVWAKAAQEYCERETKRRRMH
jgi:hypothetical protein